MPRNVGSRKRSGDASASTAKKPKSTAVRRFRRAGRPLGSFGGTGIARFNQGVVYNRKFNSVCTLKKTLMNASVFNGLGAYVSTTGYWSVTNIPDWAYCKALFSHYKLKRVKLVFTLYDIVAGDAKAFTNTRMPEIYIRYLDDPNVGVPVNSSSMQEFGNVVSFQMSPERTRCEYIIEPKVLTPLMITADNANVGYTSRRSPWINTADDTVQNWGYMFFCDYLDNSFRIVIDHEYELELKSDQ